MSAPSVPALPGVTVVVAVDTLDARDGLARIVAGCDCPRSALPLRGWPSGAAVALVAHRPSCDPRGRVEVRAVVLRGPRCPPDPPRSREW